MDNCVEMDRGIVEESGGGGWEGKVLANSKDIIVIRMWLVSPVHFFVFYKCFIEFLLLYVVNGHYKSLCVIIVKVLLLVTPYLLGSVGLLPSLDIIPTFSLLDLGSQLNAGRWLCPNCPVQLYKLKTKNLNIMKCYYMTGVS